MIVEIVPALLNPVFLLFFLFGYITPVDVGITLAVSQRLTS